MVRSERGRGSTFEVYLPLVTAPAASRAADLRPAPRSMRGTETVLIVDDEESLVRVARRILEGEGYTTLTAVAPAAALALADELQGPLHLLFTDVVMPGMSGPQLAAAITARHPETRVLYGSGYADDAVLREAVRDHAAVLLGKPYGARELLGRVRAILDRPDDSPDPAPDLDGGASGGRPPG